MQHVAATATSPSYSLKLAAPSVIGSLARSDDLAPIPQAAWHVFNKLGDGLLYQFEPGALQAAGFLTADLLLDGDTAAVFKLALREGDGGREFVLTFGLLNQCSARLAMPLDAVEQNIWMYPRQGAWLKPVVGGQRVDLARVDRMTLTLLRNGDAPVRVCLTSFTATSASPPWIASPVLPRGKLVDEMGQSRLRNWPGKSAGTAEVTDRLKQQLAEAPAQHWPPGFSRFGGWADRKLSACGFFRTQHDGKRWWLVDPDGCVFWSAGIDCVLPEVETEYNGLGSTLAWVPSRSGAYDAAHGPKGAYRIDYLKANFIRAFDPKSWKADWQTIALSKLRAFGFNTVGNWSDWEGARAAAFPYVRPLKLEVRQTTQIYRDFPDVFDAKFAQDAADFAKQLEATATDPAMVGYFLMNEPTWGFSQETPAAGMLFTTDACAARVALASAMREKYATDESIAKGWGLPITLADVERGRWTPKWRLNEAAKADLSTFSTQMVDRLFRALSDACRHVDPHHLNLGARYHTVPPQWALDGMKSFDVLSINCYQKHVPAEMLQKSSESIGRPVLVGEWHFGALDAGLPASGIGRVRTQEDRGKAFRVYEEGAAANPWCVGVHYFTLYDESALGRLDGENYNIGFLDVCNRPYEPLAHAARLTHERLYRVVAGEELPYADAPEYLPIIFY